MIVVGIIAIQYRICILKTRSSPAAYPADQGVMIKATNPIRLKKAITLIIVFSD
jgi:hypothetical protein